MLLSVTELREAKMLGMVVIYRPPTRQLHQTVVAAMVVEYDCQTGRAKLVIAGHNYIIPQVEYSETLETPNTWCFREDLPKLGAIEEKAPAKAPEADEGQSAERAAPEADTEIGEQPQPQGAGT